MSTTSSSKNARLEARLPLEAMETIRRAARLEGRSVTDFVVAAASEAARRTITETEIVRLSVADQLRVAELILAPPDPSSNLEAAAARREAVLRTGSL